MTTKIRLAKDLSLPLETTTQAIGVLAKRRAGKSYLSRRVAEQLFGAGQQIVVVDPKGDWWGIRSAAEIRTTADIVAPALRWAEILETLAEQLDEGPFLSPKDMRECRERAAIRSSNGT